MLILDSFRKSAFELSPPEKLKKKKKEGKTPGSTQTKLETVILLRFQLLSSLWGTQAWQRGSGIQALKNKIYKAKL